MADGSTKSIESIEPGDHVLATDEESGETGSREVTTTIVGVGAKVLVDVGVDTDEDGEVDDTITATDGHPIWVADADEVADDVSNGERSFEDRDTSLDHQTDSGAGSGGGGPPVDAGLTDSSFDSDLALNAGSDGDLVGDWVDAVDLEVGHLLRTSSGTWVQVGSLDVRHEQKVVYNVTVEDHHTYHVAVADRDFLTHTCSDSAPESPDSPESLSKDEVKEDLKKIPRSPEKIRSVR
ncbi:polymorphic toxin-type HINT domain-containing protein [Haloglycomyces albus]|uniref:polymorphic toxin-type HINT domain-containing protein n=1 Tax=Haloglycomyces albus TaxID=526067 RepID=UPI0012EBD618|nr:polymorphic toxin-type HINT domain-containing protein [Haloglycomyces albus]